MARHTRTRTEIIIEAIAITPAIFLMESLDLPRRTWKKVIRFIKKSMPQ